jgi:hypothetical protein
MSGLEVKCVERFMGTNLSYAYGVKAGPWIFLTGHEPIDFERGLPSEVSGHPGFLHSVSRGSVVRETTFLSECGQSSVNLAQTWRAACD